MESIPDLSHPYIPGAWLRKKPVPPLDLVRTWRAIARAHPDPVVQVRLEWVLHCRAGGSVTGTARYFGLSRKCVAKWRDRFAAKGVAGLADESRAPKARRGWTLAPETRERIADLKREFPTWGKAKLQAEYLKRFEERVSQWQIQRTIAAKGLQWRRPHKKRSPGPAAARPRIQGLDQEALRPFELLHGDSVELRFLGGVRRYVFTNLEHQTRTAFALAASTKHARHAACLLERTLAAHPELRHYHSDNGGDQAGELEKRLPDGVTHWVSRPRTPKDNARLERFHRTLQEDCFPSTAGPAPSVPEMQAVLDAWLKTYNEVRPHAALGNLTPAEYAESLVPPAR